MTGLDILTRFRTFRLCPLSILARDGFNTAPAPAPSHWPRDGEKERLREPKRGGAVCVKDPRNLEKIGFFGQKVGEIGFKIKSKRIFIRE